MAGHPEQDRDQERAEELEKRQRAGGSSTYSTAPASAHSTADNSDLAGGDRGDGSGSSKLPEAERLPSHDRRHEIRRRHQHQQPADWRQQLRARATRAQPAAD